MSAVSAQSAFALSVQGNGISAVEGIQFSNTVATFTDLATVGCQSSTNYQASVAWADDGSRSSGSIGAPTQSGLNCTYPVSAVHTFGEEGADTFQVTVTDLLGSATGGGTASVADAPLSASAVAISATETAAFTATVATFADANPQGVIGDFSATVAWGDGTPSTSATITNDSGKFGVVASHAYAQPGAYTATVTINDTGGSSAVATVPAAVADAPLTSAGTQTAATEGQAFSSAVATFSDPDVSRLAGYYSANVAWGDGTASTSAAITRVGPGSFTVAAGHTYVQAGSYAVTVTITDPGGRQTVATGSATVADAALTAAGTQLSAVAGTAFQATVATFSDADPNASTPARYSATIDWGDGTTTTDPTIATGPAGGFTVSAGHTYGLAGSFATTITVTDSGGGSASASGAVTVSAPPPVLPPALPASVTPLVAATAPSVASTTPSVASTTPSVTSAPSATKATVTAPPTVGVSAPQVASPSTLSLHLTCAKAGPRCRGVARVITLPARAHKSTLSGGTTLGSTLFILPPGGSKTVAIPVAKRLRPVLRHMHSARLVGVAIVFGEGGRSVAMTGPTAVIRTTGLR